MDSNTPKAIIITPTIGSKHLIDAVKSVSQQTYTDILHLIIVDGENYYEQAIKFLKKEKNLRYKLLVLPFNTGKNGFNGHRIYASIPYLLNSDYIFFLDEDNWYDSTHVKSMIQLIERNNLDWAYSLRKIYTTDRKYIADDNCESLGDYVSYSGRINLVDTSCYALRSDVLKRTCHIWYHPLGADRIFFKAISTNFSNYKSSKLYTVNYRLHKDRQPDRNFFLKGNRYMKECYKKFPWSCDDNT